MCFGLGAGAAFPSPLRSLLLWWGRAVSTPPKGTVPPPRGVRPVATYPLPFPSFPFLSLPFPSLSSPLLSSVKALLPTPFFFAGTEPPSLTPLT